MKKKLIVALLVFAAGFAAAKVATPYTVYGLIGALSDYDSGLVTVRATVFAPGGYTEGVRISNTELKCVVQGTPYSNHVLIVPCETSGAVQAVILE